MIRPAKYLFLSFAGAFAFASCTEVIDLTLSGSDPQLVIEAYVNDQPGPYFVKISTSVGFDEPNLWPAASGASVVIAESGGISDTLRELEPGLYVSSKLQGVPGKTYTLTVDLHGQRYTAVSTMPAQVLLDTAYTQTGAVMGGDATVPVAEFDDPAGTQNFYNFVVKRGGKPLPGFFSMNDHVRDGTRVIRPLRSNDFNILPGDTLYLEMQCVDAAVYDYFYVLGQAAGTGLSQSPTPSNPEGNFGAGVLGYFSAHTSSVQKIVVP